jgi:hypothetical protein
MTCTRIRYGLVLLLGLPVACGVSPRRIPHDDLLRQPVLIAEGFESGAARWEPVDPEAWKVIAVDGGHAYSQFKQCQYKPPFRSPINLSLVRDLCVSDFVLTLRVQSTGKEAPHRSVCIFFSYQDPARFYYVHLGRKTDDASNQIHIVDGAPRHKISTFTTAGTPWTDGWHRVKIVRRAATGEIAVYFDDFETPALTAIDTTFGWGRIGIGSFDDTGNWDDIEVRGVPAGPSKR